MHDLKVIQDMNTQAFRKTRELLTTPSTIVDTRPLPRPATRREARYLRERDKSVEEHQELIGTVEDFLRNAPYAAGLHQMEDQAQALEELRLRLKSTSDGYMRKQREQDMHNRNRQTVLDAAVKKRSELQGKVIHLQATLDLARTENVNLQDRVAFLQNKLIEAQNG